MGENKNIITVMCDYCADGLWLNGSSIDAEYLYESLGFLEEEVLPLKPLVDHWQSLFNSFAFWEEGADPDEIRSSSIYLKFEEYGLLIARLLKNISPENVRIMFFEDRSSKVFEVPESGEIISDENLKQR